MEVFSQVLIHGCRVPEFMVHRTEMQYRAKRMAPAVDLMQRSKVGEGGGPCGVERSQAGFQSSCACKFRIITSWMSANRFAPSLTYSSVVKIKI